MQSFYQTVSKENSHGKAVTGLTLFVSKNQPTFKELRQSAKKFKHESLKYRDNIYGQ